MEKNYIVKFDIHLKRGDEKLDFESLIKVKDDKKGFLVQSKFSDYDSPNLKHAIYYAIWQIESCEGTIEFMEGICKLYTIGENTYVLEEISSGAQLEYSNNLNDIIDYIYNMLNGNYYDTNYSRDSIQLENKILDGDLKIHYKDGSYDLERVIIYNTNEGYYFIRDRKEKILNCDLIEIFEIFIERLRLSYYKKQVGEIEKIEFMLTKDKDNYLFGIEELKTSMYPNNYIKRNNDIIFEVKYSDDFLNKIFEILELEIRIKK